MGFIHESATIDDGAVVSGTASVWANSHIRSGATVGEECVIGAGVYVGPGVHIGRRSKVQNGAQIYEPASIEIGVFIGPGAILTNDERPRAITELGKLKDSSDWSKVGVKVGQGASVGAGAICVAPVEIGEWAMVGAGAVVVRDVPNFALVVGNPARQIGWVGRSGVRLITLDQRGWECPVTGERFSLDPELGMTLE